MLIWQRVLWHSTASLALGPQASESCQQLAQRWLRVTAMKLRATSMRAR